MRVVVTLLLCALFLKNAVGQDLPINGQIFMNPYYYNPAFAGYEDRPAFYLYSRQQWSGIPNAPETMGFNFHTIFNKKINFGVHIQSDKRGILSTTKALTTVGYRARFDDYHYISFALSGGVGFNSIDFDAIDPNDPAIQDALDNNIFLDGNAGLNYYNKGFNLGISLPKIFKTSTLSSQSFAQGEISPMNEVILMSSYKWQLSEEKLALEPYALYHYNKEAQSQFEVIGLLHFMETLWVGASYRQDYGVTAYVGLNIKDNVKFGYGYEFFDAQSTGLNVNTHDIQLAVIFGKKEKKGKVNLIQKRREMLRSMGRLPAQQNQKVYQVEEDPFVQPEPEPAPEPAETYSEEDALNDLMSEPTVEEVVETPARPSGNTTKAAAVAGAATIVAKDESTTKDEQPEMELEEEDTYSEEDALNDLLSEPVVEEQVNQKPESNTAVVAGAVAIEKEEAESQEEEAIVEAENEDEYTEEDAINDLLSEPIEEDKHTGNTSQNSNRKGSTAVVAGAAATVAVKDKAQEEEEELILQLEEDEGITFDDVEELTDENVVDQITENILDNVEEGEEFVEPTLDDQGLYIGPKTVKKGDHLLELEKGNYVVVGTFGSYRESEEYSDKLFMKGFYTKFGFISQTKIYYVYIFESDDLQETKDTSERFEMIGADFRENWVLQVQ